MRILKVVQAYFPFQEKGGPVVKVRAIARGLAARGHAVTVLTANYGFLSYPSPGITVAKDKRGWRWEENGVTALYLSSIVHYRALTFNPHVVGFAAGSASKFDLVHIYGLYDLLGPVIAYSCRRHTIPYVVEPMGMNRPIVRNLLMKRIYHRLLGNHLLKSAHRLIATSIQEEQELIADGISAERIFLRRNGVEPPASLPIPGKFRKQWQIDPHAKLVLFLGRIVPKKSPDLLIEAFARWRRKSGYSGESVLVLAGPEEGNGYGARLKSQAAAAGLAGNVLFAGPLYDETKWAAYQDADVFVLPSQNENFGNSAAEAMACGTPVIVTDQCGIAPLIEGRSGLIVEHDSEAVANALETMLGDAQFVERLRTGCAEVVANLSWEQPLNQMEILYREMAGSVRRNDLVLEKQLS